MNKILLIEDSKEFQLLTAKALQSPVNALTIASSFEEAKSCLSREKFDLILLDVGLPDGDGFSICQELQNSPQTASIPVIFLTGKNTSTDIIAGFSVGAEDFVTKPFEALSFRARIEAKLRKIKALETKEEVIREGDLFINVPQMKVYFLNKETKEDLQLTPTEFKLLRHLVKSPERVFSREQLLNSVWGESVTVSDRTIDVHVSSLRRKLGEYGKSIQAVQNMGYRFRPLQKQNKAA